MTAEIRRIREGGGETVAALWDEQAHTEPGGAQLPTRGRRNIARMLDMAAWHERQRRRLPHRRRLHTPHPDHPTPSPVTTGYSVCAPHIPYPKENARHTAARSSEDPPRQPVPQALQTTFQPRKPHFKNRGERLEN
jgi:hypothetical protein